MTGREREHTEKTASGYSALTPVRKKGAREIPAIFGRVRGKLFRRSSSSQNSRFFLVKIVINDAEFSADYCRVVNFIVTILKS